MRGKGEGVEVSMVWVNGGVARRQTDAQTGRHVHSASVENNENSDLLDRYRPGSFCPVVIIKSDHQSADSTAAVVSDAALEMQFSDSCPRSFRSALASRRRKTFCSNCL